MARLFTEGAELRSASAVANVLDPNAGLSGTLTINTANPRSGGACFSVVTTNTNFWFLWANTGATSLGSDYYCRIAVRLTAAPTNDFPVMEADNAASGGGSFLWQAVIGANQSVYLADSTGANIASTAAGVLTLNAWHVIEVHWNSNATAANGTCELRLDGTTVLSQIGNFNTGALTAASVTWGKIHSTNYGITLLFDDVAINDATGGAQNSWPGLGKVVMLLPAADSSRVGFTGGAGATTNLFNCVKNTPPIGVVQTSGTATSQIKDATSNTTDNYVATMQTYTVGGVTPGSSILLAQGVANHGNNTATSRTNGLAVASNPVIAESTAATAAAIAGTWPSNWQTFKTAVAYAPAVTLGTAPTMTFRKGTASTDFSMCDFMGLMVEWLPPLSPALLGHRHPGRDQRVSQRRPRGRF
jgi:hypothetical protein